MLKDDEGALLGKKALGQVEKTVREHVRRMMNEQPHRARWQNHKGGKIRHGIVTASLGCGWYTIEKADWTGARDPYEECDPCVNVTGEGTDACGITIVYPASQLTGTGVFVTARDCGSLVVPLVEGTDCLIANLGDTDATTGDAVWQIVQGQMNLEVYYEEEWSCCDGVGENGTETLISRTPSILVGKRCPPISCGECPY